MNDNVVPLELGDDTNGLSNRESIFDVDTSIDFNVKINVEDVDISKEDVNVVYVD